MVAVVLVTLLGACGGSTADDGTTSSLPADGTATTALVGDGVVDTSLPQRVPTTMPGSGVIGEVPDELLALVVDDAAARAGVDVADVTVLTAQEMLWDDGSLGCPAAGETYTDAPVAGFWVVVEAASAAFDYRLTDGGTFRLCTNPFGAPPGSGAPES
jgi:hypothetical protein